MIAAIILIAIVVGVVGIASTFFTGFTKEKSASVESKSSAMIDCSVATLEIDKNIVDMGPTVSVCVENTGWTDLSNIKLVIYNSTGAYELDPSPDSLSISEIRVLEVTYPGEPILNKLSVTTRDCPGVDDSLDFTFSYQEDADETNCTGNICDGDWDTFMTNTVEYSINYTKRASSIGAIWRIKQGPDLNHTIPSDCWSYDNNKLILRIYGYGGSLYTSYCYNGTWKIIFSAESSYYEEAVWWNVISD